MEAKDTLFCKKNTLNCRGKLIDLSSPLVMGILNVTPDSFFDGGIYIIENEIIKRASQVIQEEGRVIDIGAYSTRPGAKDISEEDELNRLLPALKCIRKEFPDVIISVDTFRANIAKAAINSGADIINDISGGTMDEKMFETIADLKVPYILMHIKGTPQTMQQNPEYENVFREVAFYFSEKINHLRSLGVNDIILDPGFGFGKTLEHNYTLLNRLNDFKIFELPILSGVSRKSMINKVLGTKPEEALNGTTVLNTISLINGANILRVHDVKEAVEAVKIVKFANLVH